MSCPPKKLSKNSVRDHSARENRNTDWTSPSSKPHSWVQDNQLNAENFEIDHVSHNYIIYVGQSVEQLF